VPADFAETGVVEGLDSAVKKEVSTNLSMEQQEENRMCNDSLANLIGAHILQLVTTPALTQHSLQQRVYSCVSVSIFFVCILRVY
jgi:hypothetical protein